ncbi:MAG: bifunctional hydroxymethylpyrimidine kinase/phosphomethylpyrimidine kinase [Clostridia bacterium]|nr:bifunctional hydroxymethylpyrimidine kinase/phosphomethylpyrimidine kinase [Clostridia bacterium]
MKTMLSVAGSDSSGGAGIQADIKTALANGVYAMSVITSLTAQNTTKVIAIQEVTCDFLSAQLEAVFEDIFPDAVKIGMVSSPGMVKVIADKLKYYKAKNIVLDPVMVSTSGADLSSSDSVEAIKKYLLPICDLVTPNIPEAEVLSGIRINSSEDMVEGAKIIYENCCCDVLLKGGHRINDANDLYFDGDSFVWFSGRRIDNPNTHGTGCTLSSAIASNLAKGYGMHDSIRRAKEYISDSLSAFLNLGKGSGPMHHGNSINSRFIK